MGMDGHNRINYSNPVYHPNAGRGQEVKKRKTWKIGIVNKPTGNPHCIAFYYVDSLLIRES